MKRKHLKRKVVAAGCVIGMLTIAISGCEKENKVNETNKKAIEMNSEEILMSVGDVSVSYKEALAYIYMLKKQYEPSMSEDIWNFQMENGESFGDFAKDEIVNEITQLKIIGQEAEKEAVQLDEDEKEEAELKAKEFMKNVTKEEKKSYLLEKKMMTFIMEDHLLAKKMYDIATNEIDTAISDEQAKQATVQYLMVMTKGKDKNGNQVDMNQEEKKIAKKKAKSLYQQAKDTSGFYNLAEANTDADEVEITFGINDMPKEFEEEALSLRKGELSKLIQGENGYYIIYCINDNDEDAAAAKKEAIIQEKQDKLFRKKYKKWSKEYKAVIGTAVWDKIQFNKKEK